MRPRAAIMRETPVCRVGRRATRALVGSSAAVCAQCSVALAGRAGHSASHHRARRADQNRFTRTAGAPLPWRTRGRAPAGCDYTGCDASRCAGLQAAMEWRSTGMHGCDPHGYWLVAWHAARSPAHAASRPAEDLSGAMRAAHCSGRLHSATYRLRPALASLLARFFAEPPLEWRNAVVRMAVPPPGAYGLRPGV